MASQSTSVSFSFADSLSDSGSLSLDNWGGFVGLGSVGLSLVDTHSLGSLKLYASVGTVVNAGYTGSKIVQPKFVQVNGEDSISIHPNAKYEILFALNENGHSTGTPVSIYRNAFSVKFSHKFWGLVRVLKHTEEFQVLKYTPEVIDGVYTYGVVAAYRSGDMAICHVQPPISGTGNDELEVYRIESEMLINGEGEWEKPDGWPDNPSYKNGAEPPRPRIGVISTRVHEVGMVTPTGYFYSRAFDVANQKPYFGDESYEPEKNLVQGSGFSKLSDEMKVRAKEAMSARGKGAYINPYGT